MMRVRSLVVATLLLCLLAFAPADGQEFEELWSLQVSIEGQSDLGFQRRTTPQSSFDDRDSIGVFLFDISRLNEPSTGYIMLVVDCSSGEVLYREQRTGESTYGRAASTITPDGREIWSLDYILATRSDSIGAKEWYYFALTVLSTETFDTIRVDTLWDAQPSGAIYSRRGHSSSKISNTRHVWSGDGSVLALSMPGKVFHAWWSSIPDEFDGGYIITLSDSCRKLSGEFQSGSGALTLSRSGEYASQIGCWSGPSGPLWVERVDCMWIKLDPTESTALRPLCEGAGGTTCPIGHDDARWRYDDIADESWFRSHVFNARTPEVDTIGVGGLPCNDWLHSLSTSSTPEGTTIATQRVVHTGDTLRAMSKAIQWLSSGRQGRSAFAMTPNPNGSRSLTLYRYAIAPPPPDGWIEVSFVTPAKRSATLQFRAQAYRTGVGLKRLLWEFTGSEPGVDSGHTISRQFSDLGAHPLRVVFEWHDGSETFVDTVVTVVDSDASITDHAVVSGKNIIRLRYEEQGRSLTLWRDASFVRFLIDPLTNTIIERSPEISSRSNEWLTVWNGDHGDRIQVREDPVEGTTYRDYFVRVISRSAAEIWSGRFRYPNCVPRFIIDAIDTDQDYIDISANIFGNCGAYSSIHRFATSVHVSTGAEKPWDVKKYDQPERYSELRIDRYQANRAWGFQGSGMSFNADDKSYWRNGNLEAGYFIHPPMLFGDSALVSDVMFDVNTGAVLSRPDGSSNHWDVIPRSKVALRVLETRFAIVENAADSTLMLYSVSDDALVKRLAKLPGSSHLAAIAPDARSIAVVLTSGDLFLFRLDSLPEWTGALRGGTSSADNQVGGLAEPAIHPNPSTEWCTVTNVLAGSSLRVIDGMGRTVDVPIRYLSDGVAEVSTVELANGLYFVVASLDGHAQTMPLIVAH